MAEKPIEERVVAMVAKFPTEKARKPSKESPNSEEQDGSVHELFDTEDAFNSTELFAMLAREEGLGECIVILPSTGTNPDGSTYQEVRIVRSAEVTNNDMLWLAKKLELAALGFDV